MVLESWMCMHACMLSYLGNVWFCMTLWTIAYPAPLPMGFSRQEYWSGLPCTPTEDLPNPGIKPGSRASPSLQVDSSQLSHWGRQESWTVTCKSMKLEYTLSPYIKINSKWLKYLNIRHDTIRLLEGIIGKTFSDINHISVFLSQSPKAIEIKINKKRT